MWLSGVSDWEIRTNASALGMDPVEGDVALDQLVWLSSLLISRI